MPIFKVLGNLKNDGEILTIGSFIEADKGTFDAQIEVGVIALVKGVRTIAEAMKKEEKATPKKEDPIVPPAPVVTPEDADEVLVMDDEKDEIKTPAVAEAKKGDLPPENGDKL